MGSTKQVGSCCTLLHHCPPLTASQAQPHFGMFLLLQEAACVHRPSCAQGSKAVAAGCVLIAVWEGWEQCEQCPWCGRSVCATHGAADGRCSWVEI